MTPRGEEFMECLGNDKCGHEFYDDVEFEEVDNIQNTDTKEELKNGRTKN